jgi:hypothetical protein
MIMEDSRSSVGRMLHDHGEGAGPAAAGSLDARMTVRPAEPAQLSGHVVRCLAEDQCSQKDQ